MNRRYVLGLVGALALAGVMAVRAAAEKPKAAKGVVMGVAVAAEKSNGPLDCCCGESCCCGDACQEECWCGPVCCGSGCCCDSIKSKTAAVSAESCCEKDVDAARSRCPVTAAKAEVAVTR